MVGRTKQTDRTAPYKDGGYWYYSRTEEGKQYPVHCRRKGSLEAPEEVMPDGNELARGHKFFELGPLRVSDDGAGWRSSPTPPGPGVRAVGQGPADREARREPARQGPGVRVGGGQRHTVLPDRGRGQAGAQGLAAHRRATAGGGRARLRGEGRAVLAGAVPITRPEVPVPHVGQLRCHGTALPARGRARGGWAVILPGRRSTSTAPTTGAGSGSSGRTRGRRTSGWSPARSGGPTRRAERTSSRTTPPS